MKPVALATRVWVQWAVAQAEDPWAEPHLPAPEALQLLMSSRDLSAPESQVVESPEMPLRAQELRAGKSWTEPQALWTLVHLSRAIPQTCPDWPDWQQESPEELSRPEPSS